MGMYQSIEFSNYKGQFWASYESYFEGLWAPKVCNILSDVVAEDAILVTVGGVRGVQEWKDERQTHSPGAFKQTISNRIFENNVTIPVESYRRSGPALWDGKIQELGRLMADHWVGLAVEVLTGTAVGFDALVLFSASHAGGSNLLTNTDVPSLDVATAAAPTADEMSIILVDLAFYFMTLKNEQGVYLNKSSRKFLLTTSNPKIAASALGAINRDRLSSGTASAAYNLMQANGWEFEVALEPSLGTATTAVFYFAVTDSSSKGIILLDEAPMENQTLGDGSEYAVLQNKYLFGVKAVRGGGPGQWQKIVKCTLS